MKEEQSAPIQSARLLRIICRRHCAKGGLIALSIFGIAIGFPLAGNRIDPENYAVFIGLSGVSCAQSGRRNCLPRLIEKWYLRTIRLHRSLSICLLPRTLMQELKAGDRAGVNSSRGPTVNQAKLLIGNYL